MHIYIKEAEPEIVFTTAICAVAVRFGRFPALVLSALSAVALNLIDIPPVGMLTIPGWEEAVYIVVNIIISLALPVI